MPKFMDLTGKRFGRLVVMEKDEYYITPQGRKIVRWKCKCDCGNTTSVTAVHLRSGDVRSCGCYGRERRSETSRESNKKHEKSRTRIYHLFENMKYRCNNPNAEGYEWYGGRGISVCAEWNKKDGFEAFYEWATNNGYADDLTIDRIDVNGNYEPSNCRWVTIQDQCNNTRNSVFLTYNGKTQTAAQWAREIGVDRHTIYGRIRKGQTIEMILRPRTESMVRARRNK